VTLSGRTYPMDGPPAALDFTPNVADGVADAAENAACAEPAPNLSPACATRGAGAVGYAARLQRTGTVFGHTPWTARPPHSTSRQTWLTVWPTRQKTRRAPSRRPTFLRPAPPAEQVPWATPLDSSARVRCCNLAKAVETAVGAARSPLGPRVFFYGHGAVSWPRRRTPLSAQHTAKEAQCEMLLTSAEFTGETSCARGHARRQVRFLSGRENIFATPAEEKKEIQSKTTIGRAVYKTRGSSPLPVLL
jgi:hypothetical protein